jgi:plastocyanin
MVRLRSKSVLALASVTALAAGSLLLSSPLRAQQAREYSISGKDFAFSPARIEVQKDDLVKITFTAADMPHSFAIDQPYRIAKRAGAGQSITFEFRADQPGEHTFYCNLTHDERCRQMKGTLVVK